MFRSNPPYLMTITRTRRKAFSLLELLSVVALIGLLATLAGPAMSSMAKGGSINNSLIELSGLLSQARQYAVAQNTCVWVAFHPQVSTEGSSQVAVAVLASNSGQDDVGWADSGNVPNNEVVLLTKPRILSDLQLEEAGNITDANIPSLVNHPKTGADNALAKNTAVFHLRLPGTAQSVAFNRVMKFLPDGQVRVAAAPIDVVELGIRPMRGNSTPEESNVAVLRINGLTGQTSIFRP